MSGGIAQLVAVGAQDAHIVGNPEVSFFRSTYKRHTNFAQTVEKQVIQGNPATNGMSTVRFERKGDMLGHVYITNRVPGNTQTRADWKTQIKKVELLIGGQVIDTQTSEFSQEIAPVMLPQTYSKSLAAASADDAGFYPLRFSFCENPQSAIPLIALQYHDVEIRISWGTTSATDYEVHAQFVYLDTDERTALSSSPQNMLITQTQQSNASGTTSQELNYNHPIKFITSYKAGGVGMAAGNVKFQINGTDVGDAKKAQPHYTSASLYYHTPFSTMDSSVATHFLYPFCLETAKLQPTGTLNFSRVDSARLVTDAGTFTEDVYGVNYNILRIENGMAGLMYSN
jgi:hypothetical protein|tara:strand:+ start:1284 stop:2309 length:1026 start_codon:yes stop_codon:yes gene_type:complete